MQSQAVFCGSTFIPFCNIDTGFQPKLCVCARPNASLFILRAHFKFFRLLKKQINEAKAAFCFAQIGYTRT